VLKLAIQRNKAVAATAAAGAVLLIALMVFFIISLKQEVKRTASALDRSQTMIDMLSAGALVSEMDTLYPAVARMVPALQSWLDRTAALLARAQSMKVHSKVPSITSHWSRQSSAR
jgi:hypothetical protein